MRITWPVLTFAALALASVGSSAKSGASSNAPSTGVIVESVEEQTAPHQAGLLAGDVLVSWERSSPSNDNEVVALGDFLTPFDAQEFGTEQLPRGHTRIRFLRGGASRSVELRPGYWRLAVAPLLGGVERTRYSEAVALEQAGKYEEAEKIWHSLAQERSTAGDHNLAAWLLVRSTEPLLRKRLTELRAARLEGKSTEATKAILPQMDQRYDEALSEATLTSKRVREAQVWEAKIISMGGLDGREHLLFAVGIVGSDDVRATEAAKRALAVREAVGPDTVASAMNLYALVEIKGRVSGIGDPEKALLERALAIYERLAPASLGRANALNLLGRIVSPRDLRAAQPYHRLAATIARPAAPETESFLEILQRWAQVELDLGNLREAEAAYREVLNLERMFKSTSVLTVQRLVRIRLRQGDYSDAKQLILAAVAYLESLPLTRRFEGAWNMSVSQAIAGSMNNLAVSAISLRDYATAEALLNRTLAAIPNEDNANNNLANVLSARGDLAGSEAIHLQNLEIRKKDLARTWTSLLNLAGIAKNRGSWDLEESYVRRALALATQWSDPTRAQGLNRLSSVLRRRGDLAGAFAASEEALALSTRAGVDTKLTADILIEKGLIAQDRGDLTGAEQFFARSQELYQVVNPGLPPIGPLRAMADLAIRRGQGHVAKDLYERVLAWLDTRQAIEPLVRATILHGMGRALRQTGALDQSADYLRRAVDVLESTRGRIGGSVEAQTQFSSSKTAVYRDFIDVLLLQGRHADAFDALERARARALLETVAERDLSFARDLPDVLRTQRAALEAEFDLTQTTLLRLDPAKDAADVKELQERVADLLQRQAGVASRIRQASPGLAAVQYPQPLNWKAAQQALDAGSVLLSYSVSENHTHIFVASAQASPSGDAKPPTVITIPITAAVLRQRIEAFRELIARRSSAAADVSALTAAGRGLYDLFVRPAESAIAGNRHVLVSPDGPLSVLPFGALIRSVEAGVPRFLVEWKPLTMVPSATVFAELKHMRRQNFHFKDATVVAFGDPSYPQPTSPRADGAMPIAGDPELDVLRRGGFSPKALPASRREVEAMRRLFPTSSTIYLGADATEERAKQIGKGPAIIHFAAHGVLNDRRPLDSALLLSVPGTWEKGKENGLLQAWEIFDHLRIDADLVTLSACESGLGKELPGEGLMGLTRAFLFAGARSVVSSLWDVADAATADLMSTFYGGLTRGLTKDEALRSAQVAAIQSARGSGRSDPSKPFYWAAFQLTGDWK